jgi:hypothetical protein
MNPLFENTFRDGKKLREKKMCMNIWTFYVPKHFLEKKNTFDIPCKKTNFDAQR